ncbi:MAG TPA: hypothetical protein DEA22_11110 [Blastocatellia bacterium]|nr:hypothetical protein [Blastocatellia bacterium]
MAHDMPELPQKFDRLLAWLDNDRDRAGERYLSIRKSLIKLFEVRGCFIAEELADETIDRVQQKCGEIADDFVGDQAAYFHGVARNVFLEYTRRPKPAPLPDDFEAPEVDETDNEQELDCLENCLSKLLPGQREMIVAYYDFNKGQKTGSRKRLAETLGISMELLRIRTFRIRNSLQKCVMNCMSKTN